MYAIYIDNTKQAKVPDGENQKVGDVLTITMKT